MQETTTPDPNVINASPTKELFIYMLTKDLGITRAILDLVDNSVDGAKRVATNGKFANLFVRLEVLPTHFKITDNCGGIPINVAREYAFRFGRPAQMEPTKHSVGQFGVGMKRALFKLGRHSSITSRTETGSFVVDIDIAQWLTEPDRWEFEFGSLDTAPAFPEEDRGTAIVVTELYSNWQLAFSSEAFLARLKAELEEAHLQSMRSGLAITLNHIPLDVKPVELLSSGALRPAKSELQIHTDNEKAPIDVVLYAGIGASEPNDAGWYVFCNGRLVLAADQTEATGWGRDGAGVKFHNQYARFRGYAFCDSDDASSLPWNTTKTGVDVDSPAYQALRLGLVAIMKPVIVFLNDLDREKDVDEQPLHRLVEDTPAKALEETEPATNVFIYTSVASHATPKVVNIAYKEPPDKVERVKAATGAKTNRQVGEITFDYYFNLECAE